MNILNVDEKLQILKWHYDGNSLKEVSNLFKTAFRTRYNPSETTCRRIVRHFEATGCLHNCNLCRKIPFLNETAVNEKQVKKELLVCTIVKQNSHLSIRRIAAKVGASQSTVSKILIKYGYKNRKISKFGFKEIYSIHYLHRMEFCQDVMDRANSNENFISNILFTGESTFPLHTCHDLVDIQYSPSSNMLDTQTKPRTKVNVWMGILGDSIIGPFFIDARLKGDKYLDLLDTQVIPALRNLPGIDIDLVWFQHDGCPAHNAAEDYLNNQFNGHVISKRGNIKWPTKSSDLSPNDFFLWSYLKQCIYTSSTEALNNLEELKIRVTSACERISADMLQEMRQNFYNRLGYCLLAEGERFEGLLNKNLDF